MVSESLNALLLGIVEGLTEFLPVSSTGHLILVGELLGFRGPPGHMFEIAIQLGAILAVVWLYRVKLWQTAMGMFHAGPEQRFAVNIVLAFLPAMVLGVLFHDFITRVLFSPVSVSVALVVGGFLILLIERIKPAAHIIATESMPWQTALKVGFCQALAMVPGVSRSGATIMGSLMLGVERKAAAEFSFFLAIPTMLAATVYSLYKNREALADMQHMQEVGIGFLAAFIVALIVVKGAVAFIGRHGFRPFAYYRIAIGTAMLAILFA